jgi:hypothetical protein
VQIQPVIDRTRHAGVFYPSAPTIRFMIRTRGVVSARDQQRIVPHDQFGRGAAAADFRIRKFLHWSHQKSLVQKFKIM